MQNTVSTQYQIILTEFGRVRILAGGLSQTEAVAALDRERAWAEREGMTGAVSIRTVEVN